MSRFTLFCIWGVVLGFDAACAFRGSDPWATAAALNALGAMLTTLARD